MMLKTFDFDDTSMTFSPGYPPSAGVSLRAINLTGSTDYVILGTFVVPTFVLIPLNIVNFIIEFICMHYLLARLESAYSLIWGSHKIWGQDLGTFMISRPI